MQVKTFLLTGIPATLSDPPSDGGNLIWTPPQSSIIDCISLPPAPMKDWWYLAGICSSSEMMLTYFRFHEARFQRGYTRNKFRHSTNQLALDIENTITSLFYVFLAASDDDHIRIRALGRQINARVSFLADFTDVCSTFANHVLVEFLVNRHLKWFGAINCRGEKQKQVNKSKKNTLTE